MANNVPRNMAGIADDFWDDVTGNNEFLKIRNKFKKWRQLFVGKEKASPCLKFNFSSKWSIFNASRLNGRIPIDICSAT